MQIQRRALAALAGTVAAAGALGVAEVVAVVTGPRSSPVVAVGGVVVDTVPEPLKHLAISLFGTHDKVALLTGTTVLLALAAAGIGTLAARRAALGDLGVAAFAAVGAAAALTRPGAGWAAAVPSLAGGLVAVAALRRLIRLLPAPEDAGLVPEDADLVSGGTGPGPGTMGGPDVRDERVARAVRVESDRVARRRFLWVVGAVLAGAAGAGAAGRWLSSRRGVSRERAAVVLPAPASPAPVLPVDTAAATPGLSPFVTSNGDFYRIDTALVVPQVSLRGWRLRVHGRVRRPLALTWEQLLARPMIERYATLTCVSNEIGGGLIGNARWLGVPLRDLLAEVEPEDGADQVVGRSVDGFTAGAPTAVLRDGRDAMLAVAMNGEPLPVEHGFPVRMVVPGLYGYVSATKWLTELELTSFDAFEAHWIPRGWAARAPVKTGSRIDVPRAGRTVRAGRVVVAGVAWAQPRGISRVEVRVDDGPWSLATIAPVPSTDTWRQWTWVWAATPGRHRLAVRAADNAGAVQTDADRPPIPDGATGLHTVEITVT